MSFQSAIQGYSLISTYGIYKPEIREKLTKKYPRPSALNWLRALGRVSKRDRVSQQMTYTFYEEGNFFNSSATIFAQANTGTADVNLTLAAADHTQSGTKSFPIVGDQVVFIDETVGLVIAVDRTTDDGHIVTVTPMNASQDVRTAAVNTEKISFFSSAEGEDSDAPESRVPDVVSYSNGMQVIRETYRVTDIESKSNTWFKTGNGETKLWVKGLDESVQRFEMKEQLALLVGKQSDGTATVSGQNAAWSTQGLIPDLRANATNIQYADPINLAKFDEITTTLDQNYGDREYMGGLGLPVYQKLQAFMNTFADGGDAGISYNAFTGGKEQAVSLNLKSFHYVGFDFHFQKWDILSHRDSLGADGMPFKDLGIFMPMGSAKNPVVSDSTAEHEPAIQVTFFESPLGGKQNGGEFSVWETGAGASPIPTDAKARREIHHYMIKGLEVRNKDKFVLLHL